MNRLIRILLRIAIGVFLVLILAAGGSFVYVYMNKDKIVTELLSIIGKGMNGEVTVTSSDFNFFRYFPATTIDFHGLQVKDSLYSSHQTAAITSERAFVRVNFRDLFASRLTIENFGLENGTIIIFKNKDGYSNSYLFEPHQTGGEQFKTTVRKMFLNRMHLIYRDRTRLKYFHVITEKLQLNLIENGDLFMVEISGDGLIRMLGFQITKGFYCMNTQYDQHVTVTFNRKTKALDIPENTIYLNGNPYENSGRFDFANAKFDFHISTTRCELAKAKMLLKEKNRALLNSVDLSYPFALKVDINGSTQQPSIPVVSFVVSTSRNKLNYDGSTITDVAFNAIFTNIADSLKSPSDENSQLQFTNARFNWEGISFSAPEIKVVNLKQPVVNASLTSDFPMSALSRLSGSDLYNFSKGRGKLRLSINARPAKGKLNAVTHGALTITKGAVLYGPRSMPFNDIEAQIRFDGSGLIVDKLSCITGKSKLILQGSAPAVFTLADSIPGNASLIWNIRSPFVDLADFTPFLSRRKKASRKAEKADVRWSNAGDKADRLLDACKLDMTVAIDEIKYEKFTAKELKGHVRLVSGNWQAENVSFRHAQGDVSLAGTINDEGEGLHHVDMESTLNDVNIKQVFQAFGNFSQTAITDKNIDGKLDAHIDLDFRMNNKAVIRQSTINGIVDLSITNGALTGFQPLGKLSKLVFRNRDFTDIKFSELTNTFTVTGNDIRFDRMKINSSVMEMYVEGHYALDGKTDMDIQIPLSNLKKRDWEEISENVKDEGEKGMNVYIKAETDNKGELQFKYNPLKKIREKRDESIQKFRDKLKFRRKTK